MPSRIEALQIVLCGSTEPENFFSADTGQSATVALAGTKSHLNEHEIFFFLHDQVNFAESAAIVGLNVLHAVFN